MAREIGTIKHAPWPADVRLPVTLTFEHQAGEGAPLLPGERPNFMVGGTMEYGARTGILNILEVLDRLNIKATFLVCGTTAEKYPEPIRLAHKAGHEIAGMSYSFERVRTASREREQSIIRKATKALQDVTGEKIKGWRCPDYRLGTHTLDVLAEEGFAWDSTQLNDDVPSVYDCGGRRLVEIPFSTSTADKTFIGHPYPMRGGPDALASAWNAEFDMLYRESETAPRFLMLSIQTWATGRPAPVRTLRQFLERLVTHNDVQFARCDEVAAWCKDQVKN